MRMRADGEAPGLDLSLSGASDVLSAILSKPPRPKPPESGLLEQNRNSRGGKKDTYTGHDLVFTAKVDADGHVSSFDDKANFNYRFHLPRPRALARGAADHLDAWSEDPYGVSTGTGSPTIAKKSGEQKEPEGRVFTIVSGGFGVTDAVMRWAGQDPYNARKAAFLEETFDERVEIGTVHRAKQLDQADAIIIRHLDHMWRRDDLELAEKKELVFELWDECAESGGENLQAGGAKARAALYRWIDTHLPAGGDAAFTADELDGFNDRRRSKARFAPYD
jgi:hypothetical protein